MKLFEYYCNSKTHSVYRLVYGDGSTYYGKTVNVKNRYSYHCAPSGQGTIEKAKKYKKYGAPKLQIVISNMSNDIASVIEWIFIRMEYDTNVNVFDYPYLKNTPVLCAVCGILGLTVELKEK